MFDPDVISFAHGEGIRRPRPASIAAGVRSLLDTSEGSVENYLFLQRLAPLDEEIARRFVRGGIDEQTAGNICIDSGTTRLFMGFLHAVADPGDVFLAAPTYYHSLASWCDISKVRLVCVPTQRRNSYKLTPEDLEHWYDENVSTGRCAKPKGLFLFNPTQTGAIYSVTEYERLAEFVIDHKLIVLEDVIFSEIEFEDKHQFVHLASFNGLQDRVVTVNGGSKAHGLANIRIGWGCGPADVIERINAFTVATSATTPYIAKAMALAALRSANAYLSVNRRECRDRAVLIMRLVDEANCTLSQELGNPSGQPFIEVEHEPQAGHSILLSFNRMQGWSMQDGTVIRDSIDLTRHFLATARVAFSPGLSSGFDGCEVRLSFGCVGLEYTYEDSRDEEIRVCLEEILNQAGRSIDLGAIHRLVEAAFRSDGNPEENGSPGFEAGRRKIQTAFKGRIVPSITELARSNSVNFA